MALWRLRPPTRVDEYQIAGSLVHRVVREHTVFGDEQGLFSSFDGAVDPAGADEFGSIPWGTKYIWHGGAVNTTDDPAVRDLWLSNGFDVEQVE